VKLTCIVDNCVGRGDVWGEHGLSFLVENDGHCLLLDTASTGQLLLHNMRALGIEPGSIEALVLSHGHLDHTGGLQHLLPHLRHVPLYAHPEAFRNQYSLRDGKVHSIGIGDVRELLSRHVELRLSPEPEEVIPGVWTTGEIKERPYPEGRGASHVVAEKGRFIPAPYRDDLSLVLEVADGLVLLCGCCHAGLLNVLAQVQQRFGRPVQAIVGGTHLSSAGRETLEVIVERLRELGPPSLYLNHCTGFQATVTLARALPEKVCACHAGTVLEYADNKAD